MHTIKLVDQDAFQLSEYGKHPKNTTKEVVINPQEYDDEIIIAPHSHESYAGFELMKTKIYCEKNNTRLITYGSLNQLPFFSVFSDTVVCDPLTSFEKMWTRHHKSTRIGTSLRYIARHPKFCGDKTRHTFINSEICKKAQEAVTDEEVLERFADIQITIRKESYNLFKSLNLNRNVVHCEVKSDHWVHEMHSDPSRPYAMAHNLNKLIWPVQGFNHNFQRELVDKIHDHFMSIQTLGFLCNEWAFIGVGGSINIFSILQVPIVFGADPTASPLITAFSLKRYEKLPIVIKLGPRHANVSKHFTKNINLINDFLEGYKKPEVKIEQAA